MNWQEKSSVLAMNLMCHNLSMTMSRLKLGSDQI
jgi:hypothetical protein